MIDNKKAKLLCGIVDHVQIEHDLSSVYFKNSSDIYTFSNEKGKADHVKKLRLQENEYVIVCGRDNSSGSVSGWELERNGITKNDGHIVALGTVEKAKQTRSGSVIRVDFGKKKPTYINGPGSASKLKNGDRIVVSGYDFEKKICNNTKCDGRCKNCTENIKEKRLCAQSITLLRGEENEVLQ